MTKLATTLILLLLMLNLIPPLFRDGAALDLWTEKIIECGEIKTVRGIYFDNAYYIILFTVLPFMALSLPFLVPKLNRVIRWISFGIGGWYMFGLLVEVLNLLSPAEVFNSSDNDAIYIKFVIAGTIAIAFIITSEAWIKQKSLEK